MERRLLLIGLIGLILLIFGCQVTEPENRMGSIMITFNDEPADNTLRKTAETLETVEYFIRSGSAAEYSGYLDKQADGSFYGEISNLQPASDYALLLYGMDTNTDIVARGHQSGINVTAGNQTSVSMIWSLFKPQLVSPANNSMITSFTTYFDWNDVNGAVEYQIGVARSLMTLQNLMNDQQIIEVFGLPINETGLTSSQYMATESLPNTDMYGGIITYHWAIRARDNRGSWGAWSDVWTFQVR